MAIFLLIIYIDTIIFTVCTVRMINEIMREHITASDNIKIALCKCMAVLMLSGFLFGVIGAIAIRLYR